MEYSHSGISATLMKFVRDKPNRQGCSEEEGTIPEDERDEYRTLAEKLNHLFETVPGPDGELMTLQDVSNRTRELGPEPIAVTQLWELRKGVQNNPRIRQLEALAKVFAVPVRYFLDEEVARKVDADLEALSFLRHRRRLGRIMFKATELPDGALDSIEDMIDLQRQRLAERRSRKKGPTEEGTTSAKPEDPDEA